MDALASLFDSAMPLGQKTQPQSADTALQATAEEKMVDPPPHQDNDLNPSVETRHVIIDWA